MLNNAPFPLVLLPGTLCDARVFPAVTAGLPPPTTIVMAGASNAPDMARRILAQAPPRFALCGFSLGAIVGLEVIAQAPERVERIALLGCNARTMPPDVAATRRAKVREAAAHGTQSYISGAWDASVPQWRREDSSLRAALDALAADTPLATFAEQVEIAINRVDSRPRLPRIDVPTLVACGVEDGICPPELSREIAAAVPGAVLVIIERAGHYLTLDQPDTVSQLLRDWLAAPIPTHSRFLKEFS
jgi:pimeloyl-ACP methyl ester carboxylesterase